jgi:hypothetical protein
MKIILNLLTSFLLVSHSLAACPSSAASLKGYYSGINTTVIFSNNVAIAEEKALIRIYIDGTGTTTVWGTMTIASYLSKNTYSASSTGLASSISSIKYKYDSTKCSITQKVFLTDKTTINYTFLISNGGYKVYGINNDQISSVSSPTYYVETQDWWKE